MNPSAGLFLRLLLWRYSAEINFKGEGRKRPAISINSGSRWAADQRQDESFVSRLLKRESLTKVSSVFGIDLEIDTSAACLSSSKKDREEESSSSNRTFRRGTHFFHLFFIKKKRWPAMIEKGSSCFQFFLFFELLFF